MLYMHRSKNRQVDDAKKRRYCSCWDKKEGREGREKSRTKAELNVKERHALSPNRHTARHTRIRMHPSLQ
jgi:hypothetical protein